MKYWEILIREYFCSNNDGTINDIINWIEKYKDCFMLDVQKNWINHLPLHLQESWLQQSDEYLKERRIQGLRQYGNGSIMRACRKLTKQGLLIETKSNIGIIQFKYNNQKHIGIMIDEGKM